MPAISNIHNFKPAVKCMNNGGIKTAVNSSQAKKLTDRTLTWPEFREIADAQNLKVTECLSNTKKDAPIDAPAPTLYIICW